MVEQADVTAFPPPGFVQSAGSSGELAQKDSLRSVCDVVPVETPKYFITVK